MEGLFFYWIAWSLWIIVTFFVSKANTYRYLASFALLLLIIITPYHFSIGTTEIAVSFFLLYIAASFLFVKSQCGHPLYLVTCMLIVSFAYCAFLCFEMFDPIWVVFNRDWMLAGMLACLVILLHKQALSRICILIFAALNGEVIFALIIQKYGFPFQIGSFGFLDVLSMAFVVVSGWNMIEYLAAYLERNLNPLVKEKQNYHE